MQNLSVNMWNFPVFPFACLNLAGINGENNSTECIDFEVFEQFLEHNKCHIHVQFSSVSQSCLTLCNPMDCSTPDLPVHHQFPEFTQTHVHWVSDAIQSSHPLSSPSTPIFNVSHHQGFFPMSQLFASDGQRIGASASASVLPMNIQGWFLLGWTALISLQSKGLSRVFSNTTVQKHQFFSAQPSSQSQLSHPYMTTGKTIDLTRWTLLAK